MDIVAEALRYIELDVVHMIFHDCEYNIRIKPVKPIPHRILFKGLETFDAFYDYITTFDAFTENEIYNTTIKYLMVIIQTAKIEEYIKGYYRVQQLVELSNETHRVNIAKRKSNKINNQPKQVYRTGIRASILILESTDNKLERLKEQNPRPRREERVSKDTYKNSKPPKVYSTVFRERMINLPENRVANITPEEITDLYLTCTDYLSLLPYHQFYRADYIAATFFMDKKCLDLARRHAKQALEIAGKVSSAIGLKDCKELLKEVDDLIEQSTRK
ncbi:hypothetical protein NEOKW01_1205 [Nematocida sp. AWRm80]|nr:hypothetical protein NEOKW01_1205 [Nematocida sp. AWRm80]